LVSIATSLRLPPNLRQFCNPHMCDYLWCKSGEDMYSSWWDIWWNMPILAISSKKVQLLPSQSLGYLDHICTCCSYNNVTGYFWIGTEIFLPVPECQPAEWRSFCQFCQKLVAMATSLEELEKVVQIDHIHKITYHLVKNQENRSSGSRDNWSSVKKKKLRKVKCVAQLASLPSGLNNLC